MLRNLFALFILLFLAQLLKAQNFVVINSQVANSVNLCNEQKTFQVSIENPSSFTASAVTVTVTMPTGVTYVPSSLSYGTEQNITNLEQPVFSFPNINVLTTTTFQYQVEANCDAIAFLSGGGIPNNRLAVNYTANGNNITQNHTTSDYNVSVPNLSVSSFTNQVESSGSIGASYSRCITITNGGVGYLSEFTIENTHGDGIQIDNISIGSRTTAGLVDSYVLNGSDFTTVGDGDAFFETGESITICEDYTVQNCVNVLSEYEVFWGCNGANCQVVTTTSNVLFGNTSPLIEGVSLISDNSTCHGTGVVRTEGFVATNNGNGLAINSEFNIFQSWTSAYFHNGWYSSIDTASIMVTINNGTPFHLSPFQVTNNIIPYSGDGSICPSDNIGQYWVRIDTLSPLDTIQITWEVTECDPIGCYTSRRHTLGWFYEVAYQNICQNDFLMEPIRGRNYDYFREALASNLAPANIISGQTLNFNYLIAIQEKAIRRDVSNDKYVYKLVLPACLSYSPGSLTVLSEANNVLATEASNYVNGDTTFVVVEYGGTGNFANGQLTFDLTADCSGCGNVSGAYPIEIYSTYNSDTTCPSNVDIQMACFSTQVYVLCPVSCDGYNFTSFDVRRTNLGLSDNDNDGFPDIPSALNMSLVRDDRAMFADTIQMVYGGEVTVTGGTPNLDYFTINSDIDYGIYLTYLDGQLRLYDRSTGNTHVATGITPQTDNLTGHIRQLTFEEQLSALVFTPALPGGFVLEDTDSLWFDANYRVSSNPTSNLGGSGGNTGNNLFESKIASQVYLSDVPNATTPDRYGCNDLEGYITLIGYYHTNSGGINVNHDNCDTVELTRLTYYSVGPCCSNYAGGNLFPHEYRNWVIDDSLIVNLPGEYEIASITYQLYRSAGYGITADTLLPLTPVGGNTIGDRFTFDLAQYYNNGTLVPSDEGHYSYTILKLVPTCNTPKAVQQRANFLFKRIESYNNNNVAVQNPWVNLRYDGPELNIQTALPTVNAFDSIGRWDVTLSNNSNISAAEYTWITLPPTGTMSIKSIDTSGVQILPDANGFYQLGSLAFGESINIHIEGRYTSCSRDSIEFYTGWSCAGYPTALSNYPCIPDSITLFVVPQLPNLETSIPSHTDTLGLCDTGVIEISLRNVQTGYGYNVSLTGTIPTGADLIPGSTEYRAPDSSSYVSVADPTNIVANTWLWSLGNDELKGINVGGNEAFIRFKFVTTCEYTSGSQFNFYSEADAACPYSNRSFTTSSSPTIIDDAILPYETTVKIVTDFISPCKGATDVRVIVINNGPQVVTPQDSIIIRIPNGVDYVSNSFSPVYNSPANGTPLLDDFGTYKEVSWKIPGGTAVGDSSIFDIKLRGNKDSLDCSIVTLDIFSTSTVVSNCSSSGSPCSISTITGDTVRNVFIFKSYVTLQNDNSTSIINAPSGEIGYVDFEVYNTGDTIADSNDSYISYYFDVDNNGILSLGDSNFHTTLKNLTIFGNNGTTRILDTINIPSGFACGVIAVLDSSENACICSSTQLPLNFKLVSNLPDTATCSDVPTLYDHADSVDGYLYSWTPLASLDNGTKTQPVFQKNNSTATPDTNEYYLEIDRGGCFGYNTIEIVVIPDVSANAGIDDSLCGTYSYMLNGNIPNTAYLQSGSWTAAGSNPSVVSFVDASDAQTTVSNLFEGTYELYWQVYTHCDTAIDTLVLEVYDQPVANAGLNDSLCNIYSYTLAGNFPNGRSTGEWIADPANPSITTFVDSSVNTTVVNGMIEGTYNFYWVVSNGNCVPDRDTVIIDVYDSAISNAGPDDSICNMYTYTLAGNLPVGRSTGSWLSDAGNPSVVSFDDATLNNTIVRDLVEGTYSFYWVVSNGNCPDVIDTIVLDVFDTPFSDAGVDDSLCNVYDYVLNGNFPAGRSTGEWIAEVTNPTATTFDDSTVNNTTVRGMIEGTYYYYWTVSNGNCIPVTDTVVIDVYDSAVSNAGIDDSLCNVYTYTFNANQPIGRARGVWTTDPSNAPVTFDYDTAYNANISGLLEGTYIFYWTVSNGSCPDVTDTMVLDVFDTPFADAGSDDSICAIYQYQFSGKNPVGRSTGQWTADPTNPSIATFDDITLFNAIASNLIEGTYTFYWTVSNGNCLSVTDTMVLDVFDQPVAMAGPNDSLCGSYFYTMRGNLPLGRSTGVWTESVANPTITVFADPTVNNTAISGLIEGTYEYYWTVSNGNCIPAIDTVVIDVYDLPMSDAGLNDTLCNTYSYTFNANVPLGRSQGEWVHSNANPTSVIFSDNNSPTATISNLVEGTYEFFWVVSNGNCTDAITSVIIDVYDQPTISVGPGDLLCDENSYLLIGTSPKGRSQGLWTVSPASPQATIFSNPTSTPNMVSNLVQGDYRFYWTISNDGCPTVRDSVDVQVRPNPVAQIVMSSQEICETDCIEFIGSNSNVSSFLGDQIVDYQWLFGDGASSDNMDGTYCYPAEGLYDVELVVNTNNGCTDTLLLTNHIRVHPLPTADFSYTPDEPKIYEVITFNDLSYDSIANRTFTFSDGIIKTTDEFIKTFPDTGYFNLDLLVETVHGCLDSISTQIYIQDEFATFVPSAFSPNGDGVNDEFLPIFHNIEFENYRFYVFDRWGETVFETDERNKPWDGMFKSLPVKLGVYVWRVEFKKKNSSEEGSVTGHITVIK